MAWGKFGLALGAVTAGGSIPFNWGGKAYRGWDVYHAGIRAVEEYSPGRILRTFQLGDITSQFTSAAQATRVISPEAMLNLASVTGGGRPNVLEYLSKLTGRNLLDPNILSQGLRFEGGKLVTGAGEILLEHAAVVTPAGSPRFLEGYARSLGMPGIGNLFAEPWVAGGEQFAVIGGRTWREHVWRQMAGYGTEMVERFNRLLRAPADIPPFSIAFSKLQKMGLGLGVRPGGGLATFGKLALKLGVGLPAAVGVYKWLDWRVRNTEFLDETAFGEGITAGVATMWARSNLAYHKAAQGVGWYDYGRRQEEVAPGSTDLSRLLAFPIMGALGAAGVQYARRVGLQAMLQTQQGLSAAEAGKRAIEQLGKFTEGSLLSKIAGRIEESTLGKLVFGAERMLGPLTPTKTLALLGAAAGTALIAPYLPGALAPSMSAGELEDIYTGRTEVPVRRGRYWEAGRSPYHGENIQYFRPSWYRRLLDRPREKGIWAPLEEQEGRELSPLEKFYRKEMTYDLELAHYWDRPYPQTSPAFFDVPLIGPTLGATIGQIVKPVRLMHCFAKDTPVKTAFGWKPIGDLRAGEQVVSGSGKLREIIRVFQNNTSTEPAVQISSPALISKIKVTKGHKVLAVKMQHCSRQGAGKKHVANSSCKCWCKNIDLAPHWSQIGELGVGDYLIQKQPSVAVRQFDPITYLDNGRWQCDGARIHRKTANRWPRGIYGELNEYEWGWILGLYAAEGSHGKNSVQFNLNEKEIDVAERVKKILIRFWPHSKVSFYFRQDEHALVVNFSCTLFKDIVIGIVGPDKEKELSSSEFSEQFIAGYLTGVMEGDGHFGDKSNVILSNKRLSIVKTTRSFATAVGIVPKIYTEALEDGRIWYQIHILHSEWAHIIKHKAIRKQRPPYSFVHNGWVLHKITKITPIELYETVDLEVAEDHTYLVDEVVVHNSDEWLRPSTGEGPGAALSKDQLAAWNELQALQPPPAFGERRAYEMGETAPGIPISPYGAKGIIGEQFYRLTEMIGLPGFIATSIKERLTGTPDLFDQEMMLQSARRMYGSERAYWDLQLGGGLFSTEAYRRLIPHERRQIPQYNPIPNQMPDWLPGPGERSPDFRHGDPYLIPEGEYRLLGPGYEARYPELQGVAPADYPLIHKYRMLADVAPYSSQFKDIARQTGIARKQKKNWGDYEESLYLQTVSQLKQRRESKEFFDYKYRDKALTPIARRIQEATGEEEKPGFLSRLFGSYWEELAHHAETPLEYITPISPAHKLINMRTAVEDYERNQVFASQNAFWQHPWRDFIRPFITSTKAAVGDRDIPEHIQSRRELEGYFDTLEWVKASRLEMMAREAGDEEAVKEFEKQKRETLFGVNPYTYNFASIFRAMPRRERDYFNEFSEADMEEQKKILQLVPDNEKSLYIARWELKNAQDMAKAIKMGILTQEEVDKAKDEITDLYKRAHTEGMPVSQELWKEYLSTRLRGEAYPDWYRRVYLLDKALGGKPLPGPDWVGWNPATQLDDLKLKVVENLGESTHDYDLWPSRRAAIAYKPYINKEAVDEIMNPDEELDSTEIRRRILELFSNTGFKDTQIFVSRLPGRGQENTNEIDLHVTQDRSMDIYRIARREGMAS